MLLSNVWFWGIPRWSYLEAGMMVEGRGGRTAGWEGQEDSCKSLRVQESLREGSIPGQDTSRLFSEA